MSAKRSVRKPRYQESTNIVNIDFHKKNRHVNILPRNLNQEQYMIKLLDQRKDIVFGVGPAGTGKTLIAVQIAVKLLKQGEINRIILTRPAVSVDEDLGFLPGTLEQKMAPWTKPIFDVIRDYFHAREISNMIDEGIIEIAPLAYMRGRTFKHSFILADEMQNATPNQMKMLLTRIGEGSKMVVTGDLAQADRIHDNGLVNFINQVDSNNLARIDVVRFNFTDIERHEAVKEVLNIYGDAMNYWLA